MTNQANIRLDKWLWAARFYKTRSLAADAVKTGKVLLNESRSKPSKEVQVGSLLKIKKGDVCWDICVIELSARRGSAIDAQKLYDETPQSIEEREKIKLRRIDNPMAQVSVKGRPTKRDRRRINHLMGR